MKFRSDGDDGEVVHTLKQRNTVRSDDVKMMIKLKGRVGGEALGKEHKPLVDGVVVRLVVCGPIAVRPRAKMLNKRFWFAVMEAEARTNRTGASDGREKGSVVKAELLRRIEFKPVDQRRFHETRATANRK